MQVKKINDKKINRLAEIKAQIKALKDEADALEGEIIIETKEQLENTKFKTLTQITESGSSITVTVAESIKTIYPTMLKEIFGAAYEDMVTEEKKYTLSTAAKRLLTNIWQGKYIKVSLRDAINQLPLEEKTRKKLENKLKGSSYAADKKNLMNIGKMSEEDASEYAYMITEAATWQQFENLMMLNKKTDSTSIDDVIWLINTSVMVDETTKVSVESKED